MPQCRAAQEKDGKRDDAKERQSGCSYSESGEEEKKVESSASNSRSPTKSLDGIEEEKMVDYGEAEQREDVEGDADKGRKKRKRAEYKEVEKAKPSLSKTRARSKTGGTKESAASGNGYQGAEMDSAASGSAKKGEASQVLR